MTRSWWWRAAGFLVITLVSVVYLLPSLIGDRQLPGGLSWISQHFRRKIQLGLDLQGGLHLVYEVNVNKAVSDKADRTAADIEDKLKKDKKVSNVKVLRDGNRDISVVFGQPADIGKLDKEMLREYRNQVTEINRDTGKGIVHLAIDTDYIDNIKNGAIAQAIETIRGRVDAFGVAEPTIVRKGDDVVIELPGLKEADFERIKNNIGRTAQLEFKIVEDSPEGLEYMKAVAATIAKDSGLEAQPMTWSERDSKGEHALIYVTGPTREALEQFFAGALKEKPLPSGLDFGYEEVAERTSSDSQKAKSKKSHWQGYLLRKRSEITGSSLSDADVGYDQDTGRPQVNVQFDSEGASRIERVSGENIGRKMAILLDGRIESAPVIESRLGAHIRITLGGFGDPMLQQQEARDLVGILRTGALPAPLSKKSETKIGPTLGRDAIAKAKFSMGIGAIAVILFMLIYYRTAGLIADIAMVFNILFMVAILAGFEATLTLPGIAGLVLTVGMAVDANIIIYERIRDELRLGKSPRAAVDAGFSRAFWTVFDAHVTNFVAGIVLYSYGSGPVRGFAVTLLVGIVTNLFTSVWLSRGMFSLIVNRRKPAAHLSI